MTRLISSTVALAILAGVAVGVLPEREPDMLTVVAQAVVGGGAS